MDGHPGRLVDHNNVFVFIYDIQGQLYRRNLFRAPGLGNADGQSVARGKGLAHIIMDAVDQNTLRHPFDRSNILVKKAHDINEGKWIGVGGHFEPGESPEECLLREVKEETGLTLTSYRYRAMVTFVSGNGVTEYMSLFTADGFEGEQIPCNEGDLEWVEISRIEELNLWEGDLIFHRLLLERDTFFSLKLVYDGHDKKAYLHRCSRSCGFWQDDAFREHSL